MKPHDAEPEPERNDMPPGSFEQEAAGRDFIALLASLARRYG